MKIKKTRLLQIIQEEIARIDEVEGKRLSKKDNEVELYNKWLAGDNDAFTKLYNDIKPRIIKLIQKKSFKTLDGRTPEDIAQDAFTTILANPDAYQGESALGSFLIGNAINDAISSFRRVRDYGGRSAGVDATTISDIKQTKDSTSLASLPSGSRTISQSPERAAIAKQELEIIRKKLENAPEKDLQILKYITGAKGGADSAQALAKELGLERVTSTGNKLGRFRKNYGLKENLEEGETDLPTGEETLGDRKFNDAVAAESKFISKFLTSLNDFYKEAYQETYGVRPTDKFDNIEDAEAAIEALMNDEDAEYQGMPEDPHADLAPGPYDDYEDLPMRGSMGGSSPNPTSLATIRRGKRSRNPVTRNEELSLEETIAAVVKETLGL